MSQINNSAGFCRATEAEMTAWEERWRDGGVDPVQAVNNVLTALKAAYAEIDRLNEEYNILLDDYEDAKEASGHWHRMADIRADTVRHQAEQLAGLRASLEERGSIIAFQRDLLQAMQAALAPETHEKIADFKRQLSKTMENKNA